MKYRIFIVTLLSLCIFNLADATEKDPDKIHWKNIQGDSSRAALFSKVVQAKLKDEGKPFDKKAISFALKKEFIFPHDAIYDDILKNDRTDSIFGID
jgi:hypothetical protein